MDSQLRCQNNERAIPEVRAPRLGQLDTGQAEPFPHIGGHARLVSQGLWQHSILAAAAHFTALQDFNA